MHFRLFLLSSYPSRSPGSPFSSNSIASWLLDSQYNSECGSCYAEWKFRSMTVQRRHRQPGALKLPSSIWGPCWWQSLMLALHRPSLFLSRTTSPLNDFLWFYSVTVFPSPTLVSPFPSPWAESIAEKGWEMMSRVPSLFFHLLGTKTINCFLRLLFITPKSYNRARDMCVWELKFVCNL